MASALHLNILVGKVVSVLNPFLALATKTVNDKVKTNVAVFANRGVKSEG